MTDRLRSEADEAGAAAASVVRALDLTRALDGPGLERELRRQALLLGMHRFLESVVGPLFHRIGEEWHAGRLRIAQEHLASAVVRTLLTQLAAPGVGTEPMPRIVIATLPGERHEIGALMVAALAHTEGWAVTYLGPDLPAAEIVEAALRSGARAVALSLVTEEGEDVAQGVGAVRRGLPANVDVLVGGGAAATLRLPPGVHQIGDAAELRAYLAAEAAATPNSSSMRASR